MVTATPDRKKGTPSRTIETASGRTSESRASVSGGIGMTSVAEVNDGNGDGHRQRRASEQSERLVASRLVATQKHEHRAAGHAQHGERDREK